MARIYVSDDRFDSKVIKVYRVESKYDADLLFFEADNKYDADNKDEIGISLITDMTRQHCFIWLIANMTPMF